MLSSSTDPFSKETFIALCVDVTQTQIEFSVLCNCVCLHQLGTARCVSQASDFQTCLLHGCCQPRPSIGQELSRDLDTGL